MPATEAQKRAGKKWHNKNIIAHRIMISEWQEENYDKQLAYARKCMAKKYLWKCAVRDIMRCLL